MLKSSSRFFFPTWDYDDDEEEENDTKKSRTNDEDEDEKEKKNGKQGKTQNFFCDEDAKRHNALLAIDIQRLSDESFNTKTKKKKKKMSQQQQGKKKRTRRRLFKRR